MHIYYSTKVCPRPFVYKNKKIEISKMTQSWIHWFRLPLKLPSPFSLVTSLATLPLRSLLLRTQEMPTSMHSVSYSIHVASWKFNQEKVFTKFATCLFAWMCEIFIPQIDGENFNSSEAKVAGNCRIFVKWKFSANSGLLHNIMYDCVIFVNSLCHQGMVLLGFVIMLNHGHTFLTAYKIGMHSRITLTAAIYQKVYTVCGSSASKIARRVLYFECFFLWHFLWPLDTVTESGDHW